MKRIQLFKQQIYNDEFNQNGFVIFKGVLNNEIESIRKVYHQTLANKSKSGLYESTGASSTNENNYINEQIRNILLPFVENTFKDYTFYGGAFLVKSPVKSSELPLHQDWSFVNEATDSALFFWMPLQNVNRENGTIYLIPKSHSFFDLYRSGSYNSNRISRFFIPKKEILNMELKDGDILMYSPALFHGSYKNSTPAERVVSTALLTNKNAPFQYIHKISSTQAAIYLITPESYLNDINYLSKGKVPPNATLIKKIEYHNHKISTLQLYLKTKSASSL